MRPPEWTPVHADGRLLQSVATTVRSFEEQGPCVAPGNGSVIPPQSVGDSITLTNGISGTSTTSVFGLAQCLAGLGAPPRNQPQGCAIDASGQIIPGQRGAVFTIPVFDSPSPTCAGNFNQSAPVAGFATIHITSVSLGNPSSDHHERNSEQHANGCAIGRWMLRHRLLGSVIPVRLREIPGSRSGGASLLALNAAPTRDPDYRSRSQAAIPHLKSVSWLQSERPFGLGRNLNLRPQPLSSTRK
jgi:hypothetical protein